MVSLNERSLEKELMDTPGVELKEVHKALHELKVINKWLGGNKVITSGLAELIGDDQKFSIADLGCGGGDVLKIISQWAIKTGKSAELCGIDFNPMMISYAAKNLSDVPSVKFLCSDIKALPKGLSFDYTTCTLFCHHFDNEEIIDLLRIMNKVSRKGIIINDIHRHWFAYHSIKWITKFFSRTYLVKNDAPLSVARSLTLREWEDVLYKAEIYDYTIKWKWAFRWQILIKK